MSLRTSENQTTHDAAYGTEGESTHIYVHIPHAIRSISDNKQVRPPPFSLFYKSFARAFCGVTL
jgi:hypothetical protein